MVCGKNHEKTLINDIINEVEKHHHMKMTPKCAEGLLKVLKKQCPKYNSEKKANSNPNCKCIDCKCIDCKCTDSECCSDRQG